MDSYKKYEKVQVLFFSGTGGTKKVVDRISEKMENDKMIFDIIEIFKPFKKVEEIHDLMMVFFPIYAFNAPYLVLDFLKTIPRVSNADAVVISISAGGEVFPNFACRHEAIRILEGKGYNVFYENMMMMPSNFFEESSPKEISDIVENFSDRVTKIFSDVINGKKRRSNVRISDILISKISKGEVLGAKIAGRYIKVSDECILCGKCVRECPTSNIRIEGNKLLFKGSCALCMKCFYNCPKAALKPMFGDKILINKGYNIESFFK